MRVSPIGDDIETEGSGKYFPPDTHLLGDSAYPTKQWLLPPYKDFGRLDASKKKYNLIHSKTRVVIENTFGLLKNRWRRLKMVYVNNPSKAADITAACCVLHNYCLLEDDFFDTLYAQEEDLGNAPEQAPGRHEDDARGTSKRDDICAYLSRPGVLN
uniref:Nuclease HARBI1 n=1 Tax=Cacopsylla melanoneura TaxID=428564 RepID=A0A8D8TYU7_9HEMI